MDRLPKEHIEPLPSTVEDLKVGEHCWIAHISTDAEGTLYFGRNAHQTSEFRKVFGLEKELPAPRNIRVERLEDGWKVQVPAHYLPMTPLPPFKLEAYQRRALKITEVEILE